MSNFPFRSVDKIGQPLVSDNIEANLVAWINWNLLGVNAFGNVNYASSGAFGGSASRLRNAYNPNYSNGQLWEGFRKQWVWQSGINSTIQPVNISGVKVNGTFYPSSTTGIYRHTIDYPNGRVIFNRPIATNSVVAAEYSYNYYQTYTTDNPWWSELQRNSFRVDDSSFLISSSGFWSVPPEKRVQLPAIILEATPNIKKTPYNLGSHTHYHEQEIKMHLLSETRQDMKWIIDVFGNQYDEVLNLFDKAKMVVSGVYPINLSDGSLNQTVHNYPDLLNNYPAHRELELKEFRSFANNEYLADVLEKRAIPFYYSIVNLKVKTLLT